MRLRCVATGRTGRRVRTRAATFSPVSPKPARCSGCLPCCDQTIARAPSRSTVTARPWSATHLQDRRAESAGERVLLERDEACVRRRRARGAALVERSHEAHVDDGRRPAVVREQGRRRRARRRRYSRAPGSQRRVPRRSTSARAVHERRRRLQMVALRVSARVADRGRTVERQRVPQHRQQSPPRCAGP